MDLNADLGESFGRWTLGEDERLVAHLTSANVACGFHAGDFRVMERTVALCRDAGVAVDHCTADGVEVSGLAYFAFEGGTKLYYSPDIELTIAPANG